MTPGALSGFLFGSLRGRLILSVASIHAVLMALFIADLTQRQRESVLQSRVDEATALARALATSAAGWLVADDLSGLQELVESQRQHPELRFALLTDPQGRVQAATEPGRRGQYVQDGPRDPGTTVLARRGGLVDVAAPAVLAGRHVGWARIGLGEEADGERLAQVRWRGLLYALAAIAVGSLLAWTMGRAITRRLYAVQETMNAVRGGDSGARASLTGADEAAAIGREFNAMLDAVSDRDARLRASEEQYRRIVETAQEGIWVIDADSRTTFVNRKMARLLGYTTEEMLGAALTDFMDDEGKVIAQANVERRRQGISEQHDFKFLRKDGSPVWTLIETTPFHDEQGRYAGALGMITDVTDRRQMEEQLRQSQKLEAVARLAGGVAHDFNNLLTAVLGAAHALAEALPPQSPLRAEVDDIRLAGNKAAQLTRQLLAFARKQSTQPQLIDVGETVAAMERMLSRLIGENIELTTVRAPAPGIIRADPGQIEQVLVNLVVNARDAMPRGGRITIETGQVEVGEEEARRAEMAPGPQVFFTVTDTGTGMTPDALSHLFEPFFTTKGPGRGTGLGLSTVHGIIKQLGGGIWVSTELGRGTQFRVCLPRLEAPATPSGVEAGATPAARGTETVLVVEDEPLVRSMVTRVLRGAGYVVLDAGDGAEALRMLAAEPDRPIDLLVTDVVMPRLGGPELAARVRVERPGLKVLFVSGYTENTLDLCAQLGPLTALLPKPFAGPALARQVRELLDRGAPPPGS